MRNVDLDAVQLTDGFWADKFDLCRVAIPRGIQQGLLDQSNPEHPDQLQNSSRPGKKSPSGTIELLLTANLNLVNQDIKLLFIL
jgi:hypothetical protein